MLWTSDTGIDGRNPIELDELDEKLVAIGPLPSSVWYRDMADFADAVTDETARSTGQPRPVVAGASGVLVVGATPSGSAGPWSSRNGG